MSAYGLNRAGQRDTYATHRMRAELRGVPGRASAADVWVGLPLNTRARWIMAALSCTGVVAMGRAECAWSELTALERIRIGAAARREAGALL